MNHENDEGSFGKGYPISINYIDKQGEECHSNDNDTTKLLHKQVNLSTKCRVKHPQNGAVHNLAT